MEEFHIVRPSAFLTPFVKQYWFLRTGEGCSSVQRVIPTGCASLVFYRGETPICTSTGRPQPVGAVSGQSTLYDDLRVCGSVDMISVVFQPHGLKAFFRSPADEFAKITVPIGDTGDRALIDLQDRLTDTHDVLMCVRLVESFLLERLTIVEAYNHGRMDAVIGAINGGDYDMGNLARLGCLGYKQFNRIFCEYVGINPKEFLRVVRFQKAIHTMQACPDITLTRLALESGYYDQPHFNRDFRNFSGYTPRQYQSLHTPYSDYFS